MENSSLTHEPAIPTLTSKGVVNPPIGEIGSKGKTILIVKDYLQDLDIDFLNTLAKELVKLGHSVIIYQYADNLDDSLSGLKCYCDQNEVDLTISYSTGCIFIADLYKSPRLFIDPDWFTLCETYENYEFELNSGKTVYADENEGLRRFLISAQELNKAQYLRRENIAVRGEFPAHCWITYNRLEDNEENIIEQLRCFHQVSYKDRLFPDSMKIAPIAAEIDKLMSNL